MHSFPPGMAVCVLPFLTAAAWSLPALADDTIDGQSPSATTVATDTHQHGRASFYAKHFDGRKTASGERYDPQALTAAHRTLPLGTQVKVVNPKNDRSVIVTVNDRGPVSKHRMIDVSSAAADELGMKRAGVTTVRTQVIARGTAKVESQDASTQ